MLLTRLAAIVQNDPQALVVTIRAWMLTAICNRSNSAGGCHMLALSGGPHGDADGAGESAELC